MCLMVATVRDVKVPITDVGASSNRACAMYPTVAMGAAHALLLRHHSSDGIAMVGHLPIATEGYGQLLQRRIVVVPVARHGTGRTSRLRSHVKTPVVHPDSGCTSWLLPQTLTLVAHPNTIHTS
jgi:hypothetical protein